MNAFTRDETHAYIHLETELKSNIYIRSPRQMGLAEYTVFHVMKPLYGIPASGLHWYRMYLDHHIRRRGMTRAATNPCVLVKREGLKVEGIVVLQVDDSFWLGT